MSGSTSLIPHGLVQSIRQAELPLNLQMIASFKDIAAAMTRCVQIIEDYTRVAPGSISNPNGATNRLSNIDPALDNLPTTLSAFANAQQALAPLNLVEEKKKPKKEKKVRDPDAPKRPPSAYILFQNDVRDKIRSDNPGLAYKDILALISEQWKGLSDASRKVRLSLFLYRCDVDQRITRPHINSHRALISRMKMLTRLAKWV